ncbi:MAG: 2-oxoglutarate dehydrogenase E1 component, partial [Bauldia sp.]
MPRQDANQAFAATSFLYGANAPYLEELHARYCRDPKAVDAEWRRFFESLKDRPDEVIAEANGAPWGRPNWPPVGNGELVAAIEAASAEKIGAGVATRGAEISDGAVQQAT